MPFSPHSDAVTYHLASKSVLYRACSERGALPLWRSDQFAGFPALTNPQSLYTHPLHFMFLMLPPERALGPVLWLHFLLTGLAYYVLGRALRIGPLPCLFTGLAGLLNFKLLMAAYAGWLPTMTVSVLLPLVFASALQFLRHPRLATSLALGLAGGLCIQTGSVQLLYYAMWFLAVYGAGLAIISVRRADSSRAHRIAVLLLLAAVLAAGISAYVWLPIVADLHLLSRSGSSYEFFLFDHSLTLKHLLTFLSPEALGTPLDGSYPREELWEDVAYFGLIPFLLALAGALLGHRRRPTRFLALSFLVSLFLAADTPVLRLLYDFLPGFPLFRCPSRFLFLTALFGISLAGIGLHEIISRLNSRWRPQFRAAAALALLLIVIAEGACYSRKYLHMVGPQDAGLQPEFTRSLLPDEEPYRVAPLTRYVLNYGSAAPLGLQLVTGYDPINLRHYQLYFDVMKTNAPGPEVPRVWADLDRISRWDLLHALNVRYLVSPKPIRDPRGILQALKAWPAQPMFVFYDGIRIGPVHTYRNTESLPRAYVPRHVVQAHSLPDAIQKTRSSDLRQTAVIQLPDPHSQVPQPSAFRNVRVLLANNGRLKVSTYTSTPEFLVVSEVWHPGWRCFINGQPAPIIRANIAFMGVWLRQGSNRLEFVFAPPGLAIGLCTTFFCAALLALFATAALTRVRPPLAGPPRLLPLAANVDGNGPKH